MKRTHSRFAFSYDWDREVTTCEPEYYRWNQWFFLRMLERGIAYRKQALVNWCRECGTVLANEQVVDGCCWRHESTPVEQRALEQWFLRTTQYADELLRDIAQLEGGWPERVLTMQRNWIGRSEGAEVDFEVEGYGPVRVFTTRIDTIYGATCMILAPEHEIVGERWTRRCRRRRRRWSSARRAGSRRCGEGRVRHRALCGESVQRREDSGVGRELRADGLWHGRDHGRAGARPARFRVLPKVRDRDSPGDPACRRRTGRCGNDDGSGRRITVSSRTRGRTAV